MSLEWNKLRSWHGSHASAFEELCCQLAAYEEHPPGSTFIRKGTPDAGIECFWTLKTGEEKGWQAKFFTAPPTSTQWGEIDESVRSVLDKHPNIGTYTICLAVDRSDARVQGTTSFLDRWTNRVEKWKLWAAEKGSTVDFLYWGTHEIAERLARDEHRGRHYFWFREELFNLQWFERRLEEALASVGPRYTPELNVKLPISGLFDGLARSQQFFIKYQKAYGDIGKGLQGVAFKNNGKDIDATFTVLRNHLENLVKHAKKSENGGMTQFDWESMRTQADKAVEIVEEIQHLLQAPEDGKHYAKEQSAQLSQSRDHARYSAAKLAENVRAFSTFINSKTADLANRPALLLVGEAGTGKTHLFSDAAKHHIKGGASAILLLGTQFRNEEPWGQILRLLALSCTKEEFLGALQASAEISGRRALIFIDAINEGEARRMWATYLPSILATIAWYPWIGVAVSVRGSYERLTIPDGVVPERMCRAVHYGFMDHEYQAAKTFFRYYGIELPTVPMLAPEFQNPLFLQCFCKGLKNRGLTRVPPGMKGITAVFNFFLLSVNEKLAKPEHLDYDHKANLVGSAVKKLAGWLAQRSAYEIPREEAQSICESLLPGRKYEISLFRHLISEGIINEGVTYKGHDELEEIVTFSYERLADHLILESILNTVQDPRHANMAFTKDNPLFYLFEDEDACWMNRGILEALAIQGPERLGKEVFELLPHVRAERVVNEAFLESLLWRDSRLISATCLPYIQHITFDKYLYETFLNILLTVAANPDHPFNADFLHRNLFRLDMSDRDVQWSTFLHNQYGNELAVDRLIDWAWSEEDKNHIGDESIRLAGKALVWFLTSSNRFLRDRATKALVSLFTSRIHVLLSVIQDFLEVNDLYVKERVFAVAYGCTLRSTNNDAITRLAEAVLFCLSRK